MLVQDLGFEVEDMYDSMRKTLRLVTAASLKATFATQDALSAPASPPRSPNATVELSGRLTSIQSDICRVKRRNDRLGCQKSQQ